MSKTSDSSLVVEEYFAGFIRVGGKTRLVDKRTQGPDLPLVRQQSIFQFDLKLEPMEGTQQPNEERREGREPLKEESGDVKRMLEVRVGGEWFLLPEEFLGVHPGGWTTLVGREGKDIGPALEAWPHSPAALSILRRYSKEDGGRLDIDAQVDWSSALFPQVGALGGNYWSWIAEPLSPPSPSPRLLETPLLEVLTVSSPSLVLGAWLPVLAIVLLLPASPIDFLCVAVGALFLWPLIEYSAHRWIFHLRPPASSPFLISTHFLVHGVHHKVPFDSSRLLFPPFPALMTGCFLYPFYYFLTPDWARDSLVAGTIIGYLVYDLTHYYLHCGSPREGSYLYKMKRYHNAHHFSHQDQGYGITSPFWDAIFSTGITLRKLPFQLRWDYCRTKLKS